MVKCDDCGAKNDKEAKFCKDCGSKLEGEKTKDSPEPIISFKGRNGRIELYKDVVRLDRGTAMGFLLQGLKGKKDIYFHNITSIQIKKPGFAVGYLQFSIPGGNESRRGAFDALHDENTITFIGKDNYEKALKIKEYIEKKIKSKSSGTLSSADEIEKLHSLMEKGVISKKEFEAKKKQILDL
jgi:hypothetical protein